jgi:hypothetical protein
MSDETKIESIREIAREANEKHPEPQKAIAWAVKRVLKNPDLLEQMAFDAVKLNVYSLRHESNLAVRRYAAANPSSRTIEGIAAANGAMSLLMMTMPDGRALGDWTGKELLPLIEEESLHAQEHQYKATLYAKLAEIAGERPVSEVVGADQCDEMWRDIRGEAIGALKSTRIVPAPAANGNGAIEHVKPVVEMPRSRKQRKDAVIPLKPGMAVHPSVSVAA